MDDEARATGGLDPARDRAPRQRPRWGRRSPYGHPRRDGGRRTAAAPTYAALDLGTNNCRLLVARPTGDSFRVVDAFSRIIRLGEGISASGRISDAAIERAIEALGDLPRQDAQPRRHPRAPDRDRGLPRGRERRRVPRPHRRGGRPRARDHRPRDRGDAGRHRLHAADRSATPRASSCSTSAAAPPSWCGSAARAPARRGPPLPEIEAWVSLPVGVVTLAERHGGIAVTREIYEAMIDGGRGHSSTASRPSTAATGSTASTCSAPPAP